MATAVEMDEEAKSRHDTIDAAMNAVYRGELGHPDTSEYVYDETTTSG